MLDDNYAMLLMQVFIRSILCSRAQSTVLSYGHPKHAQLDVHCGGAKILDNHLHSPLACDVCRHEHPGHADFF
eukprot:COSAG02_NODE_182_length_30594_cov_23.562912_6_plen_73_part_00